MKRKRKKKGRIIKKDNFTALLALLAVILIAAAIVNIDVILPVQDYYAQSQSKDYNISYIENPDADVVIEEFSDFECPYCARAANTVEKIMHAYGGKVYIDFKLMPFHANSQKAAEASECARKQGMFWEYHHVLFKNQYSLDVKNLKRYAKQLNLNAEMFNDCLDSGEKKNEVQTDYQEAVNRGVRGTPTFFVNGKELVGAQPFEAFKALIDIELDKASNDSIK